MAYVVSQVSGSSEVIDFCVTHFTHRVCLAQFALVSVFIKSKM